MPFQDLLGRYVVVGDTVLVPCVVASISGTTQPALTLTTKYVGFDGNADTVSVDSKQVIKDE